MKKDFPGYFSGAAADIEKIWNECIFVLDANVLLNLYRYSDFTCSKLFEVFNALADRLWVPHQVVYEYLTNRLVVIGEQSKIYEESVKKVESLRRSLESHNQHPFVSGQTLAESLNVFENLISELAKNKLACEKRINSDEIKDQLELLLEGKVGAGFTREQLDKIIIDGKGRYEQKTPPGFCDVKKGGDSIVFADVCRPYGDYIVWLQIIDQAKVLNKPVVFVTGDTKDDWWASFQGKTLGPHPQLIQEFLLLVGKDFYMYPPDRFLERASQYLNRDASEQAVNEIRDIRKEDDANALLDLAVNVSWPVARNASYQDLGELNLSESERLFLGRHREIRDQLLQIRSDRHAYSSYRDSLLNSGAAPNDKKLLVCISKIHSLSAMIEQLEEEVSSIRFPKWSWSVGKTARAEEDSDENIDR
ncbi:PIN-like domain-containing protein [Pseudomonas chlororaphis subsp. piscium]